MSSVAPGSSFRPDVQGMRAIAVLCVLVYHLVPTALPGGYVGVDVFFVISGYLITGLLVRECERGGIDLPTFYARRIRRLLPAATLTLGVVLVATVLLLAPSSWRDVAGEVVASAFYVENWLLVQRSVDYLAQDAMPSPVRHYWSLSVEEQFYILWPLLMLLAAMFAGRGGRPLRPTLFAVLAVVSAASLGWGIWLSFTDPAPAYFLTTTRIWELGLGGLLAIAGTQAGLPRRWAGPVGWAGVGAILASAWFYTHRLPFPGYEALLPTLGALALLAARVPDEGILGRVLGARPMQYLGDISYSLYLWHWPIVVFWKPATGRPLAGVLDVALASGASLLLAHLSKFYVEDVFRHARRGERRRPFAIGAGLAGVALAGGIGVGMAADSRVSTALSTSAAEGRPGATWIDERTPVGPGFVPEASVARLDRGSAYGLDGRSACIAEIVDRELMTCGYGPAQARPHIVVVGDSHAVHWLPAFERLGAERQWRITGLTKSSCAFTDVKLRLISGGVERDYDECLEWVHKAADWLIEEQPDLVVISQSPRHALAGSHPEVSQEQIAAGTAALVRRLHEAGLTVAAIRQTPWNRVDVPQCMAEPGAKVEDCSSAEPFVLRPAALQMAAEREPALHLIDLTPYLCFDGQCPVVIGGVLVYRDAHHLTATYARSMAEPLGGEIQRILDGG